MREAVGVARLSMLVNAELNFAKAGLRECLCNANHRAPAAGVVHDGVVSKLVAVRGAQNGLDKDVAREWLLTLGNEVLHAVLILVFHVELSEGYLNEVRGDHWEVAILVHLANVAQSFNGTGWKGSFPAISRFDGLAEMDEANEARLDDGFAMVIDVG